MTRGQPGDGQEEVHDGHDQRPQAFAVAGDGSQKCADESRTQGDAQRNARTVDQFGKRVVAHVVGAQEVIDGRGPEGEE